MKVIVRRARPSAAACVTALAVTAAMILLIVFSARSGVPQLEVTFAAPPTVTREVNLPVETCYFVVLGRYSVPEEARLAAARLTWRGSAGYVQSDGAEYAVLGNVYRREAEAQSAARALAGQGISARVEAMEAPARRLTLTAGEAQIEAFLQSRAALTRAVSTLYGLSVRLDAGKIDANAARTEALVAACDLQAATETFASFVPAAGDALTEKHRARLNETLGDLTALAAGSESALYLSSRVKCALIRCLLSEAEFRRAAG